MSTRIFQNYIHYQKTGKPKNFRVDFHILAGCNFRCVMCDNWKNTFEINFSEVDFKKVILSLIKNYNCDYIRFHGQEPTLYKDLPLLIAFSKKLGLKVAIKTNASLLKGRKLIQIVKSGLDELYISLDGPNKEIHDQIRGTPGSFDQIISVFSHAKIISPSLQIYINSVVMNDNFSILHEMLDLAKAHSLDRVSFVLLNDKNRKDIDDIQLNHTVFFSFFQYKVPEIYKKSISYGIPVDFSPFLHSLVSESSEYIIEQIESNFVSYIPELEAFFEGKYGKFFYDNYGCFSPRDHASLNYNGDMYGCCVTERSSTYAVGNIQATLTDSLWDTQKYKHYRDISNTGCHYSQNCASNFSTRKRLFSDIYLDATLYSQDNPLSYYRYIKAFTRETQEKKSLFQSAKLRKILLHFYDNSALYKKLIEDAKLSRFDLESFSLLDLTRLPFIDKDFLKKYFEEKYKEGILEETLLGKTSGESGKQSSFVYPLDFKRYVRQIGIFSSVSSFTFSDEFFCITPRNCDHVLRENISEPAYVKKQYIYIEDFSYSYDHISVISKIFQEKNHIRFLQTDAKYLLYIILAFKKYSLSLPKLEAIFLTYSYTNRSLKNYIRDSFQAEVYDSYGCSELGAIGLRDSSVFGDSLIFEKNQSGEGVFTDLDNFATPFIRYKNGDIFDPSDENLSLLGKKSQIYRDKNLFEIDNFMTSFFPEIISYQFVGDICFYISLHPLDEDFIYEKLERFFGKNIILEQLQDRFLQMSDCSKFKTIL